MPFGAQLDPEVDESAPPKTMNTIRIVHFSDIHLTARPLGWRARDWLNKRASGWLHLAVGRGKLFRLAGTVASRLAEDMREQPPDHVVFSGDATALGYEAEMARAARCFGLEQGAALPGLAVPGNHDYYIGSAARSGSFEKHFAPWQTGLRIDDAVYPFAQRVGPVWLVGVNSSTPNVSPWNAGGEVDSAQLRRLELLFERLDDAPRLLVTHYPLCLAGGEREKRHRGLRNVDEFVRVLVKGKVRLWLHGHRHTPYRRPPSEWGPIASICAGSATQEGRWSYGDYTIDGKSLEAKRLQFDPASAKFVEAERFRVAW